MLSWSTILTYLLALTLEKDTFSGFEWSDWSRQQERDAKSNLPLLTDPLKNGTPKNLEVSLDIQPTSNTINWKCLCRIHKPAGMHNIIKHYSLRAIRNRWQKQVIIFFFFKQQPALSLCLKFCDGCYSYHEPTRECKRFQNCPQEGATNDKCRVHITQSLICWREGPIKAKGDASSHHDQHFRQPSTACWAQHCSEPDLH